MATKPADWESEEGGEEVETSNPAAPAASAPATAGATVPPVSAANVPPASPASGSVAAPAANPPAVTAASAPVPAAQDEPDNFPKDLKKAFALLVEMQQFANVPADAKPELLAKRKQLERLRTHVFRLQNPAPILHTDAQSAGAFIGVQNDVSSRKRLERESKRNPLVKKLLAAHDKLAARVKELETEIEALKKK